MSQLDDMMDEDNEEEEENVSDMDDEDVDDELALPNILSTMDMEDKKDLLKFKRANNEVNSFSSFFSFCFPFSGVINIFSPPVVS